MEPNDEPTKRPSDGSERSKKLDKRKVVIAVPFELQSREAAHREADAIAATRSGETWG